MDKKIFPRREVLERQLEQAKAQPHELDAADQEAIVGGIQAIAVYGVIIPDPEDPWGGLWPFCRPRPWPPRIVPMYGVVVTPDAEIK